MPRLRGRPFAGALKQTSPGESFTLGVIAALPLPATTAKAATVGTALAQHGSVAAKTTALGALLQASAKILMGFGSWMGPVVPLGGYIGYKMGGDRQHGERARRSVATFWRIMGISMLLFVFLPPVLLIRSAPYGRRNERTPRGQRLCRVGRVRNGRHGRLAGLHHRLEGSPGRR